jgi:16S rRNA C1402 (ribose-2'-O) methylase RsmI
VLVFFYILKMNNQIENLIDYLLDTETTSEIVFIENIHKNKELFQIQHLKEWELTILRKLQQVHRHVIVSTLNNVDNGEKSDDHNSDEDSSTSEDEDEEEEEEEGEKEKENEDQKPPQNENVIIF